MGNEKRHQEVIVCDVWVCCVMFTVSADPQGVRSNTAVSHPCLAALV